MAIKKMIESILVCILFVVMGYTPYAPEPDALPKNDYWERAYKQVKYVMDVKEKAETNEIVEVAESEEQEESLWEGEVLNAYNGIVEGPSGIETYYNLDMSYVVEIMSNLGYGADYWVREDGVKMLGELVMVAANLDIRPRGTILETSLGLGIVCDTGGFAVDNPYQIDIAVSW